ncbi:FAS1 domain-containing protein [Trichoderma barbatum]
MNATFKGKTRDPNLDDTRTSSSLICFRTIPKRRPPFSTMHKQYLFSLLGLFAASVALAQSPQSLLSALQANGFTEFAQRLQASELISLPTGIVVYAPNNNAIIGSGNNTVARRIDNEAANNIKILFNFGRDTVTTHDTSSGDQNSTLVKRIGKRATAKGIVYETLYHDASVRLGSGHNQTLVERKTSSASLPFVFSGLGKNVQVTGSDIPFEDGVIRPINGVLTLPRSLSTTLQALGQAKFAAALQEASLITTLENTASITVLAPSNEIFSVSSRLTKTQLAQMLKEHIIISKSFSLYSPLLEDGQILRTLGGTNISVAIKDDVTYLNGARIAGGDSLIENGVVHTIDKMLSENIPTIPINAAMMTGLLSWETLALSVIGTAVAARHLFV